MRDRERQGAVELSAAARLGPRRQNPWLASLWLGALMACSADSQSGGRASAGAAGAATTEEVAPAGAGQAPYPGAAPRAAGPADGRCGGDPDGGAPPTSGPEEFADVPEPCPAEATDDAGTVQPPARDAGAAADAGVPVPPPAQCQGDCSTEPVVELCQLQWGTLVSDAADLSSRGTSESALAASPDGGVVLVASFSGSIEVPVAFGASGGTTLSSEPNIGLVAKVDGNCQLQWLKSFEPTTRDGAVSIGAVEVDPAGEIYVAGSFWGTLELAGAVMTSGTPTGGLLFKLDARGEPIWARAYTSRSVRSVVEDVELDAAGAHVYVRGHAGSDTVVGATVLGGGDGERDFIAQLDPNGTHAWTLAAPQGRFWSITPSPDDTLVLYGQASGELTLGGLSTTVTTPDRQFHGRFLAKLTQTGVVEWLSSLTTPDTALYLPGSALALPSGEIRVVQNVEAMPSTNSFEQYTSAGAEVATTAWTEADRLGYRDAGPTFGPDGGVLFLESFFGALRVSGQPAHVPTGEDRKVMLIAADADGSVRFTHPIEGPGTETPWGAETDVDGDIFVAYGAGALAGGPSQQLNLRKLRAR